MLVDGELVMAITRPPSVNSRAASRTDTKMPAQRTSDEFLSLLVEQGENLALRIARGPISDRDALPVAKQIAHSRCLARLGGRRSDAGGYRSVIARLGS